MMKESNGVSLQANIYYSSDDKSFTVTYEMNGEAVKKEVYPNSPRYFVDEAISSWFEGVNTLNG